MGEWDKLGKKLVQRIAQTCLKLFHPGLRVVTAKPPELEDADLEMDNLFLTQDEEDNFVLVNIEVQTYNNKLMGHRLLGYNVAAWAKYQYKFPVCSCVIYLLRGGKKPTSPLILDSIRFEYSSQEIGKWTAQDLLSKGEIDLLPFFPLTVGGLERKQLEAVLDQLDQLEDRQPIADIYAMASLAYEHYEGKEPDWFVRKRSVMGYEWVRDIPFIQEAIQYGRAEGLEQGLEQGLAKGRVEGRQEGRQEAFQEAHMGEVASLRDLLLTLVKTRFPTLLARARTRASHMKKPEVLKEMLKKLMLATTPEEAQQILLARPSSTKKGNSTS